MARRTPVGVIDGSDSSGTGSYNLTHPAAPNDRQNVSDAYALGILADADTVAYKVSDDQTSGTSLDYEYGIGTLSSSGQVLSRDTILESSNGGIGGSKVNWTPGGERTVTIVVGDIVVADNNGSEFDPATFATNLGLPRLAASNTFTSNQVVDRSSFPGLLDLGSDQALANDNIGGIRFFGHDDAGNNHFYAQILAHIGDPANGSERGYIKFRLTNTGSNQDLLQLDHDGTLKNPASGNKYDAFPSGQQLTSHTVPPAGWSRVNVAGERVVKLAESGDTVGATGGSWTVSGLSGSTTVNNHTLTINEMPSHDHPSSADGSNRSYLRRDGTTNLLGLDGGSELREDYQSDGQVGAQGGGAGHNHTASTSVSSNGTWRPAYRISCIIEKD